MKQYFYPVHSADNPHRIHLEPISEEVYRAVYPEIWRTQKRMRKSGRCVCPKHKLWACDGDCGLCAYVAAGSHIPLEAPASDSDSSVADAIPDVDTNIEEIIEDMAILDALHDELLRLGPEGRAICKVKGLGMSEREAARILGMNDTTFRRHWLKIRALLYRRLKDYI